MRQSSIVLLSGGLDSLASFHWASQNTDLVFGLTFDYGQRAAKNEIDSAAKICRHYDIKHVVIDLPWYATLKSNALTDPSFKLPEPKSGELNDPYFTKASAMSVWIPNRNGVFINIAAAYAENWMASLVIVGFNREEAETFPDNSGEFSRVASEFLHYSTNGKVKLSAPMQEKNKTEIVQWMMEVGASHELPLQDVWSCYRGSEKGKMCGVCESCARLKRGLVGAGAGEWLEKLFGN
ncbi:MAG: 7-cyano-7-deazaguanine synthase QueC [Deltaproteobacteria bacterium]|nr:7-cyano-7-deazaguanine synthase QueC [Deltaproteobacteria bacterium]